MSLKTSTAEQLGDIIGAVRAEKASIDIQRRHTQIYSSNEKAQRLVKRLQECDANIASLLSQAADCLQVLVTTSAHSSNSSLSSRRGVNQAEDDSQKIAAFEAKAQEWYATLHDVQIGLRSAARNLHKVQQPPLSKQASTQGLAKSSSSSSGISVNQTRSGSATKGHSLAIAFSGANTPSHMSRRGSNDSLETVRTVEQKAHSEDGFSTQGGKKSLLGEFVDVQSGQGFLRMQDGESDEESKLSLSALRQQEKGWSQLANALSSVASERRNDTNTVQKRKNPTATDFNMDMINKGDALQQGQNPLRELEAGLPGSFSGSDQRLISALLHLYMEVLPETSITPLEALKP